ncbi:MAG: excinuclease ABC subunit A [Candidatus Sungbacteria bacterium RIFCSPLOWO2_02_FULL_51_17]|uniref:UvrABC system protein A n=1 Tax=Candidatus Sungbacteria bacterium RIFCSPHIGHO2_02_FULL_51_29 TaxID=1802273 RepID=A0A1G2KWB5_9BACT|nr:MAG: excinuclease ABC subunit A [Candidatus Sungbacteria bacterium RIFCSPHIGHO2_01_FULL_51_22]OHA03716.1 MAG: excinuclease ABC subunit A [Candidatus Sungbacteria bacterium RIFCSPHIGHO2_02_FULL_51_29]OHA11323.1 MAG: excinuclease ABC subunit A [Candidatus Sungbacteria bacterium RIFCSPLOWO2_02_FULL_51_17]
MKDIIKICGARVHNLKDIDVDIPKNKLVVITGLSGSGKSSLAFDTIYAEAERRFVESLSSYARQFLGIQDKPDVEKIEGLSPAISIDQKSVSKNPRSTVGTITEIYDYLRILFARAGKPFCPKCGKPIGRQTVDQIVDRIQSGRKGQEIMVVAPMIAGKKGEHRAILEEVGRAGFLRVRIDGELSLIDDAKQAVLDKKKKHSIEVLVDRFVNTADIERSRVADSVETALKVGKGVLVVSSGGHDTVYSEKLSCVACGIDLLEVEPRIFSFNSPYGACPDCTGLGSNLMVDPALVFPNTRLTLAEGAIKPWATASHRVGRQSWYWWLLTDLSERHRFSLDVPVGELPEKITNIILYGEGKNDDAKDAFEGVIPNLKRRWKETDSEFTRAEIEKYMIIQTCPACAGKRLRPEALAVKILDRNIADVSALSIEEAKVFIGGDLQKHARTSKKLETIALPLIKEIVQRLNFLMDVGLEYLTVDRESTSLSGGEAQRIRLATQIGSQLTGILYILDEPSIGLHQRDQARLIKTLKELRDLGNTVIVVEHDSQTMKESDWIIDLGPGAGKHGGKIIFAGTPKELLQARTLTGDYVSGRKVVDAKHDIREGGRSHISSEGSHAADRRSSDTRFLTITGAEEHNLKNITVRVPLGKFVSVTGVSGSGKSSLVNDILAKALLAKFYGAHVIPGRHKAITGAEHLDKAVVVDQSPIGRTPRSNPATYTGAFGHIRNIFAGLPESRARGFDPGRFSFNVKGGRCEACEGQGVKKIEMFFLPDVYVECEECGGKRYNREALSIEYKGLTISQVLDLTIEDAVALFKNVPAIDRTLRVLVDVGLGYMKLGQSATTLSGGEAQRIKLASELSRKDTGRTLYILDEPTTGLHFDDIRKLLVILRTLVQRGNTVLVIEHNLDVIRNSDWVIDLGPEGGAKGGTLVAEGTPDDIADSKRSYTGQWLKTSFQ